MNKVFLALVILVTAMMAYMLLPFMVDGELYGHEPVLAIRVLEFGLVVTLFLWGTVHYIRRDNA